MLHDFLFVMHETSPVNDQMPLEFVQSCLGSLGMQFFLSCHYLGNCSYSNGPRDFLVVRKDCIYRTEWFIYNLLHFLGFICFD